MKIAIVCPLSSSVGDAETPEGDEGKTGGDQVIETDPNECLWPLGSIEPPENSRVVCLVLIYIQDHVDQSNSVVRRHSWRRKRQ